MHKLIGSDKPLSQLLLLRARIYRRLFLLSCCWCLFRRFLIALFLMIPLKLFAQIDVNVLVYLNLRLFRYLFHLNWS